MGARGSQGAPTVSQAHSMHLCVQPQYLTLSTQPPVPSLASCLQKPQTPWQAPRVPSPLPLRSTPPHLRTKAGRSPQQVFPIRLLL